MEQKIYYRFSEYHLSVTINKCVSLKLSVLKVIPKPFYVLIWEIHYRSS